MPPAGNALRRDCCFFGNCMNYQEKIDVVSRDQIILLCARALRLYDTRLLDHGERVAHIALCLRQCLPQPECLDVKTLIILAVFHDIGAFKTDEIDRMLNFENGDVKNHSVYGYLFFKYFTPLSHMSEVILYHHSSVEETQDFAFRDYANLIYLADRIDIAIVRGTAQQDLLAKVDRPYFRADYVAALRTALTATDMYAVVAGGTFKEKLQQKISELDISSEEAATYLRMLVYTIGFKSQYTVLHSLNTTVISVFLARKLGFDATRVQKIYFAALVHDLGKMATPQSILESPDRLSPDQMEIMRQHVRHTQQMIENLLPEDICRIAVRHHEKLDGSGYPLGLTADTLTVDDRIVAIADIAVR